MRNPLASFPGSTPLAHITSLIPRLQSTHITSLIPRLQSTHVASLIPRLHSPTSVCSVAKQAGKWCLGMRECEWFGAREQVKASHLSGLEPGNGASNGSGLEASNGSGMEASNGSGLEASNESGMEASNGEWNGTWE